MKNIVLFLIILSSLFGQSSYRSSDLISIKGVKTKTLWVNKYEEKFGKYSAKKKMKKRIVTYDKNGYAIERVSFYSDARYEFKYDSNWNMIEELKYDSKGTLEMRHEFNHDINGNLIEEKCYGDDCKNNILIYKYDINGNNVQISNYSNEGKIIDNTIIGNKRGYSTSVKKYDLEGNLIEQTQYKGKGGWQYEGDLVNMARSTYKYDKNGNEVEWIGYFYDLSDIRLKETDWYNEIFRCKTKYDSEGNKIEEDMGSIKKIYNYENNRLVDVVTYAMYFEFGEYQYHPFEKSTYEYEEY